MTTLTVGCKNPANAGPFGGCAAVQMGGGNSTATTDTSTSSTSAATSAAASTATADSKKIKRGIGMMAYKVRNILSGLDD